MTRQVRGSHPTADWPHVGSFSFLTRENRWEWSDEVARMHGYEPETVEPTTERVLSHKHPDDKPTVAELIEQVRLHGAPFSSLVGPHIRGAKSHGPKDQRPWRAGAECLASMPTTRGWLT